MSSSSPESNWPKDDAALLESYRVPEHQRFPDTENEGIEENRIVGDGKDVGDKSQLPPDEEDFWTIDFETDPRLFSIEMPAEDKETETGGALQGPALISREIAERAASEKLAKCCNEFITQRQRELRHETVECQDLSKDREPIWSYDQYFDIVKSNSKVGVSFGRLFGQESGIDFLHLESSGEHAAVYAQGKGKDDTDFPLLGGAPKIIIDDILWCFEYDLIDPGRLHLLLEKQPSFALLRLLAVVGEIYREPASGGATILCSITDKPFEPPVFSKVLGKDDWVDIYEHVSINSMTAIALIGYFETGNNVIDGMKGDYNIIGLSGGDSIFVRTAILNDPEILYPDYTFTRILGNTGKAGFSILTSPSELMVRKVDPSAWRVESTEFDGLPMDSFAHTSLHLSFTDWHVPLVQFQSVGQRDADINIVETVISVRDAGRWVADVDIYRALLSGRLERLGGTAGCEHMFQDKNDYRVEDQEDMLSIETWDQVLDQVDGSAVVRCFDNWVARLAILSVLCQHSRADGRRVVVCSKNMCWECGKKGSDEGLDVTYVS